MNAFFRVGWIFVKSGGPPEGKFLSADSERAFIYENNSTLVIKSVHLEDNGTYRCHVNTSGFPPIISKPSKLIVIGKYQMI